MRFWIVNIYRLLIMNRYFLVVASLLLSITAVCQNFDEYFSDATLRLDYVFAGNRTSQAIYLDGLSTSPRWYGRRVRLDALPLAGNGQITVTDSISGIPPLVQHTVPGMAFNRGIGYCGPLV